VLTTAATVENLDLLAGQRADLGFGAIDAVVSDPRVRAGGIGAICRLNDSFLHLVVPTASPIRTLPDCVGHRVAVGAAGSGTEFTSLCLLSATGIRPAQLPRLGQVLAMQAVGDGTVDAAFSLTGFPTPAITELVARRSIRLIPLGTYFHILDRSLPRVYGPAPIPDGAYDGVTATDTVYVPNVLLARPGLPDDAVTLVIEAAWSPSSRRFWVHPDSGWFDIRAAIATGPLQLHPAALAWLRAHKP
jgi:TRAP transporter TAXI family solute receptor